MPSQPCLTTRHNSAVPQFRRAIPADLFAMFGCRELGGSLQTRIAAEAKRRRNALVAATDHLFQTARAMQAAGTGDCSALLHMFREQRNRVCAADPHTVSSTVDVEVTPPSVPQERIWPTIYNEVFDSDEPKPEITPGFTLQPHMIPRLLSRRRAVMLQGDDVLRKHKDYTRQDLQGMRDGLTTLEQEISDDVLRADPSSIREQALTLLAFEGIDMSKTPTKHFEAYLHRFLEADLELIQEQLAQLRGSRTPTPELPIEPLDTDDWEIFIEKWSSVRRPKPSSLKAVHGEIERFRAFSEDKSPVDLTPADVRSYLEFRMKSVSRHRAKTLLSLMRPVIEVAISEGITSMKTNPFANISIEVSEKDIRSYQPFSPSQLQAFFDGPVHRDGLRPGKGGRDAAFWLPLLSVYGGVRLEEAGTLTTSSLFKRAGRYWLRIGKSKNANGLREVPLHCALEELGFVDYVQAQSQEPDANSPLFPQLKPKQIDGKLTRMFSTWVNEYIDEHVVDDRQYTYHSFRNNFEDALTCEGVAEDVRRALMGHAQSGMTRRYGRKNAANRRIFPDRILIDAIDRLVYEGLGLRAIQTTVNDSVVA